MQSTVHVQGRWYKQGVYGAFTRRAAGQAIGTGTCAFENRQGLVHRVYLFLLVLFICLGNQLQYSGEGRWITSCMHKVGLVVGFKRWL